MMDDVDGSEGFSEMDLSVWGRGEQAACVFFV